MKRYIILGALLVSAVTHAHANIGDSRADSAKRYGQPTSHSGNYETYLSGNWVITEWFNPAGYAEAISYIKANGTITSAETKAFTNVNVRATGWHQIPAHSSQTAVGQTWLTNDNTYRYEIGSSKIGDYWYSYLRLSTITGEFQMNEESQAGQSKPASSDDQYLPL